MIGALFAGAVGTVISVPVLRLNGEEEFAGLEQMRLGRGGIVPCGVFPGSVVEFDLPVFRERPGLDRLQRAVRVPVERVFQVFVGVDREADLRRFVELEPHVVDAVLGLVEPVLEDRGVHVCFGQLFDLAFVQIEEILPVVVAGV